MQPRFPISRARRRRRRRRGGREVLRFLRGKIVVRLLAEGHLAFLFLLHLEERREMDRSSFSFFLFLFE